MVHGWCLRSHLAASKSLPALSVGASDEAALLIFVQPYCRIADLVQSGIGEAPTLIALGTVELVMP